MKVVTADQMRRIDTIAIEQRDIPGTELMDRAGKTVTREILERFEPDSVAVVTGKGNNAGDGFVVARELERHGVTVRLYMLRPAEELSGDALDACGKVPDHLPRSIEPAPTELREQLPQFDLVVDAMFGTGIKGSLRSPWDEYVEAINACRMNVVSIDIPSGMPSEGATGEEPTVHPVLTVTMGLPKLSMVMDPGLRSTGRVVVADIGFPDDLVNDPGITTNLVTLAMASEMLPPRPPNGHKGTFGRVLILGGSEGMTGAAVMAAQAAARSGAGLVYSAYPQPLGGIMEGHLIEPVKLPLPGEARWFTPDHLEPALTAAESMDALAIGPGLGRRPDTARFLREILCRSDKPIVVDADGLNLLAEDFEDIMRHRPAATVLTPHPGEAARLLGCSVAEVQADRLGAFVEMARNQTVVTALKGSQTIITAPDGQRFINPTGNTGLAKGGSGDILTGLIAGLLAQGSPALDATVLGTFMHGFAADIVAETIDVRAMLPSEVLQALGLAFKRIAGQSVSPTT